MTTWAPFPGPFVSIEGIDGAGKTIQVSRLPVEIHGFRVFRTCQPTHGPVGASIRQFLMNREALDLGQMALCHLFAADRAHHLEKVIFPKLSGPQKRVVVCDRYVMTTLAYQTSKTDSRLSVERVLEIHDFPPPGLTLFLDVDPEIALERIHRRGTPGSEFETLERLEKISQNFRSLATNPLLAAHHIRRIDANGEVGDVAAVVRDQIQSWLEAREI